MFTEGKALVIPIKKLNMSVTDVIVTETAASESIKAVRFGTLSFKDDRRHADNITNVSSIPTPKKKKY